MVGGGGPDRGRCRVEVVVDGAADVEIRGDTATLRDLKGQPPQFRRFECSGAMPGNAGGFRFAAVGGRGSQQLVRDPRNGGVAIVHIEDPEGGADTYAFEITWGGGDRIETRAPERDYRDQGDRDRRAEFSPDEAMRSCQGAVRQQAAERFDAPNISFRGAETTDNPGPRDSVRGVFEVRRRDGRDEAFRYTCTVDFGGRRVTDVRIEPFGADRVGTDRRDRGGPVERGIESCRGALRERMARDGFRDVQIDSIRVDDRDGRGDRVIGDARADSRAFRFSCSVDPRDGDVRGVEVQLR
jgi:hypothetical protein